MITEQQIQTKIDNCKTQLEKYKVLHDPHYIRLTDSNVNHIRLNGMIEILESLLAISELNCEGCEYYNYRAEKIGKHQCKKMHSVYTWLSKEAMYDHCPLNKYTLNIVNIMDLIEQEPKPISIIWSDNTITDYKGVD